MKWKTLILKNWKSIHIKLLYSLSVNDVALKMLPKTDESCFFIYLGRKVLRDTGNI